jgi:hypothetical protein
MGLIDGSTVPFFCPMAIDPAPRLVAVLDSRPLAGPVKLGDTRTAGERQAILAVLDSKFFANKQRPLGKATCAVHHIDLWGM